MAYLLSFSPEDQHLFEAFWIGYRPWTPRALGAETKSSIRSERELKERSIEGGSIKLAHCPGAVSASRRYANLRTLRRGRPRPDPRKRGLRLHQGLLRPMGADGLTKCGSP